MGELIALVWYSCGHRGGRKVPEPFFETDIDQTRAFANMRLCPACARDRARQFAEEANRRIEQGDTDPWPTST